MNNKEILLNALAKLAEHMPILINEFPLDDQAIQDSINANGLVSTVGDPDSWLSAAIQLKSKRILMMIELHGTAVPVVCIELNCPGVLVGDVLDILVKNFNTFQLAAPCYHDEDGLVYHGREAFAKYAASTLGKLSSLTKKPDNGFPSGDGGKFH